ITRDTPPTSCSTRSRISSAALLVNVIARISPGRARPVAISHAIRWVSTRVLPEPAPAITSSGPSPWVTASRWAGLRSASRRSTRSAPGAIGAPCMASVLTDSRIVRGAAGAALGSVVDFALEEGEHGALWVLRDRDPARLDPRRREQDLALKLADSGNARVEIG